MSLPRGPISLRIHALYNRRPGTHWSAKEVKALGVLVKEGAFATPAAMADFEMVERFYAAERKKKENGIHRRDLLTFLNRYRGEVDKARDWAERSRPRRPRPAPELVSKTDPTGANILVEEQPEHDPTHIREQVNLLREQLHLPPK